MKKVKYENFFIDEPEFGWAVDGMKKIDMLMYCRISDFTRILKLSENLLSLYKRLNRANFGGMDIFDVDILAHDFGCSAKVIEGRLKRLAKVGLHESRIPIVPSFVYFIQEGTDGPIKIGTSENPRKRLKHLQTGHPKELVLMGAIDGDREKEFELHQKFDYLRLNGEWFKPDSDLLLTIAEACNESARM